MKHLLERWSQLEPHLCKRETRPNVDWHEEFEDYSLFSTETKGWYLVYSDSFIENYKLGKEQMLMKVQWAVQQALISKHYDLMMEYTPEFGYRVEAGLYRGESDTSMAEALLTAYLEALSD